MAVRMLQLLLTAVLIGQGASAFSDANEISKMEVSSANSSSTDGDGDATGVKSEYGKYRHVAVADDTVECSKVGTYILSRGGSVVDSVIAVAICNGVINQHNSGLGGGYILMLRERAQGSLDGPLQMYSQMARVVGPAYANEVYFYRVNESDERAHPDLMCVPSEVAGYWQLHQNFGRLPWADLFAPSIAIAEEGWEVTNIMQINIEEYWPMINISEHTVLRDFLLHPDGSVYREGDVMRDPRLADTLRRLAEGGAHSFYNGSLLDDIMEDIKEAGGSVAAGDFSAMVLPRFGPPVTVDVGDMTVSVAEPPSSGLAVVHALQILEGYGYSSPGNVTTDDDWALLYHRFAETMKLLVEFKHHIGDSTDPDALKWNAKLQDPEDAAYSRGLINDSIAQPSTLYEQQTNDAFASTSHIVVYGDGGQVASMTTTIGHGFGCKIKGRRTGIVFNNEMIAFANPVRFDFPGNYAAPNKSPLSSVAPTILTDKTNTLAMSLGASGSSRIYPAVAWVILLNRWLGMSLEQAVNTPRVYPSDDTLYYDQGIPEGVMAGLRSRGHQLVPEEDVYPYLAVVQAVVAACPDGPRDEPCITAVADYRKQGKPDGY